MPDNYVGKIDDDTKKLMDSIRGDLLKMTAKLEKADVDFVICVGSNVFQRSHPAYLFSRMWILLSEFLKKQEGDQLHNILAILLEGLASLLNRRPILAIEVVDRYYRAQESENEEAKIVSDLLSTVIKNDPAKPTGSTPDSPVV